MTPPGTTRTDAHPHLRRPKPLMFLLDIVRGALVGSVETVPGVSGGTVALVVGLYDRLIASLGHMVSGVKDWVVGLVRRDPSRAERARENFRQVHWWTLLPVGIGMLIALAVMAGVMSSLVEAYPVHTSAAFFGMVLASLYVPFSMVSRWRARDLIFALVAAAATFLLVSLPPSGATEPNPLQIVLAAAVAVSALVLPGLSGSFLLLTFGMYEATLGAVSDRDLGYIGLFFLGALLGVVTVIKGLQWLLEHRFHITLVILTGVMAGALRALWPWTSEENALQPVGEHAGAALAWAIAGFLAVALTILVERLSARAAGRRSVSLDAGE
ncbi:DUF368 domain-containing protein [Rothia halotolerans]|uniref:DUF368 domain-containing protein n=1 Tax=Rothia halotolerans TaxID=405770 RepID=UPI00192DEC7F|nr:DUF368 domain-containing protein [Rothia halotolerans]